MAGWLASGKVFFLAPPIIKVNNKKVSLMEKPSWWLPSPKTNSKFTPENRVSQKESTHRTQALMTSGANWNDVSFRECNNSLLSPYLGGGFKKKIFSPLLGEMIQFD